MDELRLNAQEEGSYSRSAVPLSDVKNIGSSDSSHIHRLLYWLVCHPLFDRIHSVECRMKRALQIAEEDGRDVGGEIRVVRRRVGLRLRGDRKTRVDGIVQTVACSRFCVKERLYVRKREESEDCREITIGAGVPGRLSRALITYVMRCRSAPSARIALTRRLSVGRERGRNL